MTNRYYDPNRMYEITDLTEDHIWYAPWGGAYDPRGTIIQPDPKFEGDTGAWIGIKLGPTGFPSLSTSKTLYMGLKGMRLRPLTQKEMEKIRAETTKDRPTDRQEAVAS